MNDAHYLTKEGYKKLDEELAQLKTKERQRVADRISAAIEMGDLSENAEYSDAKDEQAFIEGRIIELEQVLRSAVIIENHGKSSSVQVGSTVKVKVNKSEKEFTIVGPEEADPASGIISHESPLGRAFIGHKVGDSIEVTVPKGKIKYKVIAIS